MTAAPIAVICMMLALSLGVSARSLQEEAETATFRGRSTAWDIISNDPNLDLLQGLIEANNLTAALNDRRNPVTVFAPNNEAIRALLGALPTGTQATNPVVVQILLQHVVNGNRPFSKIGTRFESLNRGNSITRVRPDRVNNRHNKTGKVDTATLSITQTWTDGQGRRVTVDRVVKARSGAVHLARAVLLPNNAFTGVAQGAAFYGYTAIASLIPAELIPVLNDPAVPKTVFAPNNAAFAAIAANLTLTPEQVNAVLAYHVSVGALQTVDWTAKTIPTFLTGATLNLQAPNLIVAQGYPAGAAPSKVVIKNIYYPGGVVQGVDKVLIPVLVKK